VDGVLMFEEEGEMSVHLGVKTCDKCGKIIEKTQEVFVVSDGEIKDSNELLELEYSQIYFVCHKDCWDDNIDMEWA
jgi:hypothetical protein